VRSKNKKRLTWEQKVRRWAMRYLVDLDDDEYGQFMASVRLGRNMPFARMSRRIPMPKATGKQIRMYSYVPSKEQA
jgi:hypothetical protein